MAKYQYVSADGRVVNIYDYAVMLATADGNRYVTVEAETYKQAEEYAKNIVINNEPYLEAMGKICVVMTDRKQPATI